MRSVQRSLCAGMLALQAVVVFLTTPVMLGLGVVSTTAGLLVGIGLTLACLVAAGMLRHDWAYYLGFGVQVATIAVGLLVPIMFLLGAVFLALWLAAYLVGAKVDRERAAYTSSR